MAFCIFKIYGGVKVEKKMHFFLMKEEVQFLTSDLELIQWM